MVFLTTDFENCSDPSENNQLQSMPLHFSSEFEGGTLAAHGEYHYYHVFCAHVDTDEDKNNIPLLGNSYW